MPRKRHTRKAKDAVAVGPPNIDEREQELAVAKSPAVYDPLDLRTLAENMVRVVLDQPVIPLGTLKPFEGSGIYVIYYTGNFPPYQPIANENRDQKWGRPIYVGEATRKGGRKGGVLAEGPAGKAILERLGNHADSIRSAENLAIEDFWCRYLVLKDFFIPLCESLLIDRYEPIWNKLIDGFGNKPLGGPRQKQQAKSMWDVLHPGRAGAAISPNRKYPASDPLVAAVEKFLAGEPVAVISTDEAVEAAHESGKDG
jgi:hypothetical protein